jgi:hypothetical protein
VDISVWPLYALWPATIQRDSLRNMSSEETKFDPSRRRLCPDGACVGLLDQSGRCKECGKTASGAPADDAPPFDDGDAEDVGFDLADDAAEADAGADPLEASAAGETGGFDSKRKLCPDDSCVGVLAADGRCPICGRAG